MSDINVILPPIPDSLVIETLRDQAKEWAEAYHDRTRQCHELQIAMRELRYENEKLRAQLAAQEDDNG